MESAVRDFAIFRFGIHLPILFTTTDRGLPTVPRSTVSSGAQGSRLRSYPLSQVDADACGKCQVSRPGLTVE